MDVPHESKLKLDRIGYWSEIKLDIVKRYASEYSKILAAQPSPGFYHVYIDAFAGAGMHVSRRTGGFKPGSPLNALLVTPPFREYHLIDIDREKVDILRELVEQRRPEQCAVHVYEGDCNSVLLTDVFPTVRYEDYRRALCLLDPYGLHLDWKVVETAGRMRSIDMFLNFPVADMNRKVFWRNPAGVAESDIARMNAFWGDESWREVAYTTDKDLFQMMEKTDNETIAGAYRQRLRDVAHFKRVPRPLPMRNSKGSVVYYLFFASQKPVASRIVEYIFDKYRKRGQS